MKTEQESEYTLNIPGAWYGNDPGFFPANLLLGNVVIDARKIAQALKWLNRRARVCETFISNDANPGIGIVYRLKPKRAKKVSCCAL